MVLSEILLNVLTIAYGLTGIVGILAYWPTISDLLKKKPSANVESYSLWTITTAIATLYAIFKVEDAPLTIVIGLNFLCCATILVLDKRLEKRK
jgi:hypothetical protein